MSATLPGRGTAALSGVLAAGVALGVGELAAAPLEAVPSPVTAVGRVVIDVAPRTVREGGIEAFGTADKPALVLGTILVVLALGALVGLRTRRAPAVAAVTFAAFGALGVIAASTDPTTSWPLAALVAVLAAVGGVVTLRTLLRAAPPTTGRRRHRPGGEEDDAGPDGPDRAGTDPDAARPEPRPEGADPGRPGTAGTAWPDEPATRAAPVRLDRRRFVALAVGAGSLAVVAGSLGRVLARGGVAAAARARTLLRRPIAPLPPAPAGLEATTPGVSPLFTPLGGFYRIDTALVVPDVDIATWRLRVGGMVERPFSLSYDELAALPQVEADITLCCVSNEVGGRLVGTARWQGVLLQDLLDRAGVKPGATQLVGRAVDGFTVGFPTSALADGRRALVALGMGGEPLPLRHGFPARLVVPGLYGYVSATKWLEELELTTLDAFDAYWVPRGWAKEAPIKTSARIDVPRFGPRLPAGRQAVAGVAWAPTRRIGRVEVQVDDGPWNPAELGPEVSADAWRQWVWTWDATPGDHVLRARAVDGNGEVQAADQRPPAPDGATGLHRIRVTVV